ncbi:Predicted RNA-binding protein [Desulfatibacillum alkenivorans DSM 16219]|jgi:predicted RNA-binding protein|uniref:Predicted RNA-binding protein n=1 Tax=Desulfatibacillum alkenivorans DSM 16219 TaxID=1121393 RepID=A0A1M7A4S8_9BACT|nr:CooT family nickel-binding protein [Desulfatibacillum alkenivorans]SHL37665.1 Predicted RNA-binding protein [Desulfatibacillum alkenivorans DSM 16219]
MCEANAYYIEDGEEQLIMEAVDTVTPEPEGILLTSIFGDQKLVKASIHSLSLVDHKVYLQKNG